MVLAKRRNNCYPLRDKFLFIVSLDHNIISSIKLRCSEKSPIYLIFYLMDQYGIEIME